jgi:cellulose synthase/poly-beta-1,6-N-acetylglucosamine synthase-like glycosyltransferase
VLRFGRTLVAAATTSVVGATSLLTGYLGLLTVAAILPRPRSRARTAAPGRHRFAILVPAHDEETIIGRALEAFAALDYPRDRFEVHVVADNCTDRTADVVRGAGFEAHERIAPAAPGKGAALNWLVEIVESHDVPPDAYVIVDADTTLDAAFLTEMDDALCDGASAAQGYYAVSDPDTSTAAGLRFAALACRHHLHTTE